VTEPDAASERAMSYLAMETGQKVAVGADEVRRGFNIEGDVFGLLTAVRIVDRSRRGNVWLLRCECGQYCTRSTAKLNYAKVNGFRTGCRQCVSKFRASGFSHRHTAATKAACARFISDGTLWGFWDEWNLSNAIRSDMEKEFGAPMEMGPFEIDSSLINGDFGEEPIEPMTMQEIAEQLGVSRERIRQLVTKALRRLRRTSCLRALREFLEFNDGFSGPCITGGRACTHVRRMDASGYLRCDICGTLHGTKWKLRPQSLTEAD